MGGLVAHPLGLGGKEGGSKEGVGGETYATPTLTPPEQEGLGLHEARDGPVVLRALELRVVKADPHVPDGQSAVVVPRHEEGAGGRVRRQRQRGHEGALEHAEHPGAAVAAGLAAVALLLRPLVLREAPGPAPAHVPAPEAAGDVRLRRGPAAARAPPGPAPLAAQRPLPEGVVRTGVAERARHPPARRQGLAVRDPLQDAVPRVRREGAPAVLLQAQGPAGDRADGAGAGVLHPAVQADGPPHLHPEGEADLVVHPPEAWGCREEAEVVLAELQHLHDDRGALGNRFAKGVLPRHILPRHILPRHILPRHILPRHILPRHILPRHILPRHILPRYILPRHILPRHIFAPTHFCPDTVGGRDGGGALSRLSGARQLPNL